MSAANLEKYPNIFANPAKPITGIIYMFTPMRLTFFTEINCNPVNQISNK
jgi:hypothetical protein